MGKPSATTVTVLPVPPFRSRVCRLHDSTMVSGFLPDTMVLEHGGHTDREREMIFLVAGAVALGIGVWMLLAEPTGKRQGKSLTDRSWEREMFGEEGR